MATTDNTLQTTLNNRVFVSAHFSLPDMSRNIGIPI